MRTERNKPRRHYYKVHLEPRSHAKKVKTRKKRIKIK